MLRVHNISIVGALALALAVPAAAGAQQDLRSPDARGNAVAYPSEQSQSQTPASESSGSAQAPDLRSPDAVDAAAQAPDLRSPDAVDAAASQSSTAASTGTAAVAAVPATSAVQEASSGLEWGDAAIGAAGMLALILVVIGGGMLAVRYRHGHGHEHGLPTA
ncbi:MAG TPA: hypothetical protein VI318_05745 [Baekduia sp.]